MQGQDHGRPTVVRARGAHGQEPAVATDRRRLADCRQAPGSTVFVARTFGGRGPYPGLDPHGSLAVLAEVHP